MNKYLVEYNFVEDKPMNIKFFNSIWIATDFIENCTTDGELVELEEVPQ